MKELFHRALEYLVTWNGHIPVEYGRMFGYQMAESERFQIVSRRKGGKRSRQNIGDIKTASSSEKTKFDLPHFERKLTEARHELNVSEYKENVLRGLKEALGLLNVESISDIVCYGLGHFSEHWHARYQLALLMILKEHFSASVHVYDPLFFNYEINFLKRLADCHIIDNNEEGKRVVKSTSLVFLPHCAKQLTNNFLYVNWSPSLRNSIIFANSFRTILDSHTDKVLSNTASYIVRIDPFATEIELRNCFQHPFVFNDLALHVFTEHNLSRISEAIWNDKTEPKYQSEDIEFITNSFTETLKL